MSGELSNIGLITVLKADKSKPKLTMFNDGIKQSTSTITELADIPESDANMHNLANKAILAFNALHAVPASGTSGMLNSAELKYITAYNKNAAFIQSAARDAAILAGDVNVGLDIVKKAGYYVKSPKSPTTKSFTGEVEGAGSVRITDKSVAPHAGYIRQYGKTTAKGVPPTVVKEMLFSLEVTIMLTELEEGTIIGIRQAVILPIPRKADDSQPETNLEKKATIKKITKSHIPVFSDKAVSNYQWSDWIYITII